MKQIIEKPRVDDQNDEQALGQELAELIDLLTDSLINPKVDLVNPGVRDKFIGNLTKLNNIITNVKSKLKNNPNKDREYLVQSASEHLHNILKKFPSKLANKLTPELKELRKRLQAPEKLQKEI